jgi:hypothetical protein
MWVSRQLGCKTPCPWHAGQSTPSSDADDGARVASAERRPTAERPWPFTYREYARLLLLRGRLQSRNLCGYSTPPGVASETWPSKWVCPPWLCPYLDAVTGLRNDTVETLLNDRTADAETEPDRAWRIDQVRAQVRLLERLHTRGLLRRVPDAGLSE